MKIAFRIEDGTAQLILSPENARDKTCLSLCLDGKADIRLKPTKDDSAVIEFIETKPVSIEPEVLNDDSGERSVLGRVNQAIAGS